MRRLSALALCLAVSGALVGCDDSEGPQAPPEAEGSVSASDEARRTSGEGDTAATTSADAADQTADPGVPEMPAEATEDSEAGAAAFAEYYIHLVNYLGQYPEEGILEEFATEQCSSCHNYEGSVAKLARRGNRRSGPVGIVESTQALASASNRYEVLVTVNPPRYAIVNREDEAIEIFEDRPSIRLSFDLLRTESGYLSDGVFVIRD